MSLAGPTRVLGVVVELLSEKKKNFFVWLSLTDTQRATRGLPVQVEQYARLVGVTSRTLRNWRQEAGNYSIDELAPPPPPTAVVSQQLSDDDVLALGGDTSGLLNLAFSQLGALVAAGDQRAIQTLLNTPVAKSFMDAQSAQFSRTFEDLDDDALMGEILAFVSDEALEAEVVRRRGGEAS